MLATDGLKKKAANHAESLVNCVVLLPWGGSFFLDILRPKDAKKDVAWTVAAHEKLAKQAVGDAADDEDWDQHITGVVMDNTATNRKAMDELVSKHPSWVAIGCVAHALNLLVKDLAYAPSEYSMKEAAGPSSVLRVVQKCSLVLGDSAAIRRKLQYI